MNQWECELKLKFGRRKRKVGFCFEWYAWLIAYSLFDCEPDEFMKKDQEEQLNALAYGAAYWFCIRRGKKIFFTYEDIIQALNKATREENKQIVEAFNYAQFPEWFKGDNKKKAKAP
jgi:hypothetical protein